MQKFEIELKEFNWLIQVVSRHHAKWIAGRAGLSAHTRKSIIYFRDTAGAEVHLSQVHAILSQDAQSQRQLYNLWMSYAR